MVVMDPYQGHILVIFCNNLNYSEKLWEHSQEEEDQKEVEEGGARGGQYGERSRRGEGGQDERWREE